MPFAGYKNFADCLRKVRASGKSKESAQRICGSLYWKYEGKRKSAQLLDETVLEVLKGSKTSFVIQSLIFPKKYWNKQSALKWASSHNFKSSTVRETGDSWRVRQRSPEDFQFFRTLCLTPSHLKSSDTACRVKAVGGRLK